MIFRPAFSFLDCWHALVDQTIDVPRQTQEESTGSLASPSEAPEHRT
jgi:hypothetical protein